MQPVAPNPRPSHAPSRRRRPFRFGPFVPPALVLVFLLCSTVAIQAELVVFDTGDVLKVSTFEISQGDMILQLATGGRMRLRLGRIARILDDEIVEPEAGEPPIAQPRFEIGYLPSHPVPTAPYGKMIHEAARRYRVNPQLVTAMVQCESRFNPWATSPRGAAGLLQLMPATAQRFGITDDDRWDPAHNLDAGVAYVRWLADHFDNNLPLVLAAFNSGEGAVERYGGIPPFRETQDYVHKVYVELGLASAL
jgi:transglycosylase-like protein with SLT domain